MAFSFLLATLFLIESRLAIAFVLYGEINVLGETLRLARRLAP